MDNNKPFFNFLGYNIQKINYQRLGDEQVSEMKVFSPSSNYNKKTKIYSVVLEVQIDFNNSKNNSFQILGGFKINNEEIFDQNVNVLSILSASLFPFLRTLVYNTSLDDREPIKLPTIDLRYLDVNKGISITRKD